MGVAVFDAMVASRNLDLAARYLRAEGPGVYTIGSAGHESNAGSRRRSGRPTRRSSITARAGSSARGRSRSRTRPRYEMCSSASSRQPTNRFPAGDQGVRQPRPCRNPANLDDRLSSPPGDGGRVCDRARAADRCELGVAGGRGCGQFIRRCLEQPLDRPRRAERRGIHRPPGTADAGAVLLRGQRPWN